MLRSLLLCSLLGVVAAQDDSFDEVIMPPREIPGGEDMLVQVHRHCNHRGRCACCWLLLGSYHERELRAP